MSWLSRVRSGIPFLPKRQTAENLWHKCSKCGTMVFVKEWEENYSVCPRCNFHDRIGPTKRFEQIFDAAEYEVLPTPEVREDPLRFKDQKRYTDRLKTARAATGERDALISARGRLDGRKVIMGVQDFAFMGGSMGIAVGAAIVAVTLLTSLDQSDLVDLGFDRSPTEQVARFACVARDSGVDGIVCSGAEVAGAHRARRWRHARSSGGRCSAWCRESAAGPRGPRERATPHIPPRRTVARSVSPDRCGRGSRSAGRRCNSLPIP